MAMSHGGLSAVKLEKAIINLERKMREEFNKEIKRQVVKHMEPYIRQVKTLKAQVQGVSVPDIAHVEIPFPEEPAPWPEEEGEMVHLSLDALFSNKSPPPDARGPRVPSLADKFQERAATAETSDGLDLNATFSLDPGVSTGNALPAPMGTHPVSGVAPAAREVVEAAIQESNLETGTGISHKLSLSTDESVPGQAQGLKCAAAEMLSPASALSGEDNGSAIRAGSLMSSLGSLSSITDPEAVEEPVAFLETAWNLVLVLGHTKSGWIDIAIACFLWLASFLMQISFFVILLSPDFLGEPFENNVEVARGWREAVAHDHKYMDLSQESLVSRVCRGDGTLVLSNAQAALLEQINAFLGLGKDEFEVPYFQPGVLLCMMCILLWCLYLVQEFRTVMFSLEAVSHIPLSRKTEWVGRGGFKTISYGRFAAYCMMRLSRFAIAVGLLYAGVQWLSRTTSITELILNAVALSAVLQIDEMIFAALMPKKVQICIQDLEAIKVKYSRLRSQLESVILLVLIIGLMAWPWMYTVGPLGSSMLEVKRQYCGGNTDFVVSTSDLWKITVGYPTKSIEELEQETLRIPISQYAVRDFIWKSGEEQNSNFIFFQKDEQSFQEQEGMTIYFRALHDSQCLDWDQIFLTNQSHELQEFYRVHFYSAGYGMVGATQGLECAVLEPFCHGPSGSLVRHVCPRTCGCHDQYANPLMKVLNRGCSNTCETEQAMSMRLTACEDMNMSNAVHKQAWDGFWDGYVSALEKGLATDFNNTPSLQFLPGWLEQVKATGCQGLGSLMVDPVLRNTWCEGNELYYAPLAHLCPRQCGCHLLASAHCPQSCQGCADAAEFPPGLGVANCAQAKAVGMCQIYRTESVFYCAQTCELCDMLHNNGVLN